MKLNSKLIDKTDFIENSQSNSTEKTYSCNFINTTYNNYIIEESTSGNWRYRKWSNGTAECWKRISGGVSVTTQWGNGLYYGTIPSQNFPSGLFKETPVVSYQNLGGTSLICMNSTDTSITGTGSIQVARGTSNANASYSIGIFAIGIWK